MSKISSPRLLLGALPLLLVGASAVGSDGVEVNITNDGTEDIEVTVYDLNVGPNAVILSHARINGFTKVPVTVAPGETGMANLSWRAVTADANNRKCGRADGVRVSDSSLLKVHADSSCQVSQT
jgi:hypothetical protein